MTTRTQDKESERTFYDDLFRKRKAFDQFVTNDLYEEIAALARSAARGNEALDIGCGSGTQSFCLLRQGFAVVAVDLSFEAAKVTKHNAAERGLPAPVARADAEQLPFLDGTFAVCVCSMLLHHFSDLAPIAKELRRVLKPGGVVLALDANAHNPFSRFFFNVLHRFHPMPHLTPNQRALQASEIEQVFSRFGFREFRFLSRTTELRRDFLGRSLLFTLNFYTRKLVLEISRLLPFPLARGNALVSMFRLGP